METQSTTSGKVKILFTVLGLIAAISVANFFSSFTSYPFRTSSSQLTADSLENPDEDVDHDGLTNIEESYWSTDFQHPDTDGDGFKDGEEVASGHNPTIAGPKDELLAQENLTEKTALITAQGLMAGDLKRTASEDTFNQALQDITRGVLYDFQESQPVIIPPTQQLSEPSAQLKNAYLRKVSKTIQKIIFGFGDTYNPTEPFAEQTDFFLSQSLYFKEAYESLLTVPVPKDWAALHQHITDVLFRSYQNYLYIAKYSEDPIRAALAVEYVFVTLQDESKGIVEEINRYIVQDKIVIDDSFYQVVKLIYR